MKSINISQDGHVEEHEDDEGEQFRSLGDVTGKSKSKKRNKQGSERRKIRSRNKNSKSRSPHNAPFEISLNPNNILIGGAYNQLIDPSLKSKVLKNAQNIYLKEIFQT